MSSLTPEWATPQALFDELNREFQFTLDPCATKDNSKCARYYTKEDDGLSKDWSGERVFMNPPYGRVISKWVEKAYRGGGANNSVSSAGTDRYEMVSRLYLRQSGNQIYKRTSKIQ